MRSGSKLGHYYLNSISALNLIDSVCITVHELFARCHLICLISRAGISETIATLASSPPGTRRASDGIPPASTALSFWAV